ncbi:MAG: hypothetical protein AAGA31_19075 [Bacteroidota bacterium]
MMQTKVDKAFNLPTWWYILPAYLTLWTLSFSLYNFFDGNGMMEAFGIDTGGASDFIMLNSAGRYVALAVAMIVGIWVLRTFSAILTALLARLSMDILDLVAGLQAEVITDATGVIQSFLMFLLPNLLTIWWLLRYKNKSATAQKTAE